MEDYSCCCVLSGQEERIERGDGQLSPRPRINKFLKGFRDDVPRIDIQRAVLFTRSMKETESYPMVLRRAMALKYVMENIDVVIQDDELIVGTAGGPGRHSILFPELRGPWFAEALDAISDGKSYRISAEEVQQIKDEVIPYWKGKSSHEYYLNLLPKETKEIIYGEGNWGSAGMIQDNANINETLNWAGNYKKVIDRGLLDLRREMEERLQNVKDFDFNKKAFYEATIITCDASIAYAKRYAAKAREMAAEEKNATRKAELERIAENCEHVPAYPARNFWEALQSLWFTMTTYKLECPTVGVISLGRFDQYMYPTFAKDYKSGAIDDNRALELMECLWLKIAAYVPYNVTATKNYFEGYCHFEQTVLGGQTRDGRDASNELTYLVLRSKKEFPLHYPDLSVRVHSGTPDSLLHAVAEVVKEGTGFPKLLNDDEIIPHLLCDRVSIQDARDYTPCACTEVRLPDLDTYFTVGGNINLAAALEMALNDGTVYMDGEPHKYMTPSVAAKDIQSYEDVFQNLTEAWDYLVRHYFIRQSALEITNSHCHAIPFFSMLNESCVKAGKDAHQHVKEYGVYRDSGTMSVIGFGTVAESLSAIKKNVFEDQKISIQELRKVVADNFQDHEDIRQLMIHAPQYGNNNDYADAIACQLDDMICRVYAKYRTANGPQNLKFVPVTTHVAMGKRMGATPNGRRAGEALSEGISPTQGRDSQGPVATLESIAKARSQSVNNNLARLLNIKFNPQVLAGEKGTRDLMQFIRTFIDLKLWHVQFAVINRETLLKAQKDPEKYRNLIVRVAGYSAYFTDLSPKLQEEIINRTEHESI